MRTLVLGAAVSGRAAARLAIRSGQRVTVWDADPAATARLTSEGIPAVGGSWSADLLEGVDLVVVSPGIPEKALPVVETLESRVTLWSEVEFAWRQLEAPVVAVTGTNGKTTVTSLIADMLGRSGLATVAAGNIGTALSDVAGGAWDVAVVEVSSFQLRFTERFRPEVAVLLNVAPDHLDWHGSIHAYAAAKARIFANQGPEQVLVYDADDPGAAALVESAGARLVPASGRRHPSGGVGVEHGVIAIDGLEVPLTALVVGDPAYLLDIAAAGAAALAAGATTDAIAAASCDFRPAAHRREVVGTWNGVTWVDDSKATNPHAALAALDAYPSVVLIAGGRSKGLDLTPLAHHPHLRRLVAIGEAAPVLLDASPPGIGVWAGDMAEAVRLAGEAAVPGDVVLLAPGGASFDMFESYAHRGEVFADEVRRHSEADHTRQSGRDR
jgi:UDP-N-acetylmuramoylalanine--D-glutamate ligase